MRGVAAVAGRPGDFMHVLAGESGVAPAAPAIAAGAAEPADARARAHCPALDALAERLDDADHLVAGNARILDARHETLHGENIAVADAARLHANAHLLPARERNVPLLRLQWSAGPLDDHRAHSRHVCSLSIEDGPKGGAVFRRTCGGGKPGSNPRPRPGDLEGRSPDRRGVLDAAGVPQLVKRRERLRKRRQGKRPALAPQAERERGRNSGAPFSLVWSSAPCSR